MNSYNRNGKTRQNADEYESVRRLGLIIKINLGNIFEVLCTLLNINV